jgi:hypothetical protein
VAINGYSLKLVIQGQCLRNDARSWNRDKRTGYKVVRLLFDGTGKPTGEI